MDRPGRRVAGFFAGYILKTDLGIPFEPAEYAEAVHAEAAKLDGPALAKYQYYPPPDTPVTLLKGKRFLEGVSARERSPGVVQLDEGKDASFHPIIWTEVPVTAGKTNALTINAWRDQPAKVRLEMLDASNSYCRADFDLVKQRTISAVGNDVIAQIDDLGKGWKRLTLAFPLAASTAKVNVSLMSGDGDVNFPGDSRSLVITEPMISTITSRQEGPKLVVDSLSWMATHLRRLISEVAPTVVARTHDHLQRQSFSRARL